VLSYTNFGESSLVLEDEGEIVVPSPLTELYDVKYKEYSQDELVEQAEQLFQSITITNEQALIIEEKTRGQSSSPEWHEQRHGQLTASVFHDVWARKDSTDPDNLVRRILYGGPDLNEVPAIQWGVNNEGQVQSMLQACPLNMPTSNVPQLAW